MKKFLCGLLAGVMLLGCTYSVQAGVFKFKEAGSWGMFRVGLTDSIKDFVDTETGVHYLVVFDDKSMNAICPRYNRDGSIMIDKE